MPSGAARGALPESPSLQQETGFDSSALFVVPEAGSFVRYVESDGIVVCRQATQEEALAMAQRDPNLRLHVFSPIRHEKQQDGLRIILRSSAQLNNFPEARAAFLRAAATWEALIQTPITIVIDVDFGPTRIGQPSANPSTLGSTNSQFFGSSSIYPSVRSRLIAGASNLQEALLYNSLPAGTVPTDSGNTAIVVVPSAVFRALGLLPPVADPDEEGSQLGFPPRLDSTPISDSTLTPQWH